MSRSAFIIYRVFFFLFLFPFSKPGFALTGTKDSTDKDFTIVLIPDTQYYTSEKNGGKNEMFIAQTKWIYEQASREKIAYVIHLGDVSDDGEKDPLQWSHAAEAMYLLEKPQPGYPQGIPYGVTVGNHDQTKSQYPLSGKTSFFNKYFGIDHFRGKKWYGGHYRNDNDSHYDLFSAAGINFIAIYFEYDSYDEDIENLNNWAAGLLETYKDRKALLISHSITHLNKTPGTNEKGFPKFSKQGKRIFDRLKSFPNVFLTVSGHVGDHGEGYRMDGYAGNIIKSFLTDYQSRPEGGHGLMRTMEFSKSNDRITFRTFSPYTGEEEQDGDSNFTLPWMHHTNVARYMDFDNDQLTDIVVFKKGSWYINGIQTAPFGQPGDLPAPADYNGDGKYEKAVFRPASGLFLLENGKTIALGKAGDIPVCGDYDGDGFAEVAVYRPSNGTWYINGLDSIRFGNPTGVVAPGDYDGDGLIDVGLFRRDNSFFQTALGNIPLQEKHVAGDIPVPADYNGDGKTEMAVYRPGTGEWIIDRFKSPIRFGAPGDIPVPGNYIKGGKTIPAVYRKGHIILQNSQIVDTGNAAPSTIVNIYPSVRTVMKLDESFVPHQP